MSELTDSFGHEHVILMISLSVDPNDVGLRNTTVIIIIYIFTGFYITDHYSLSCQRGDNRYYKYILKYIWAHTYVTEHQTAMCNPRCQMCFQSYVYNPESCLVIYWRADIWIIIISVWTKNRELISQPFLTSLKIPVSDYAEIHSQADNSIVPMLL